MSVFATGPFILHCCIIVGGVLAMHRIRASAAVVLTHWGRATHIRASKLTIIDSDNGLSPGRRQAIIWPNAGIFLIGSLGRSFSEISIGIQTFSFKKIHLKCRLRNDVQKMAAISQTTHLNAFSWIKMLNFHWSFFLRVQSTIFQHWFRWWLRADRAQNHYLNQWWLDHRHNCVTRPQWVNYCIFIHFSTKFALLQHWFR